MLTMSMRVQATELAAVAGSVLPFFAGSPTGNAHVPLEAVPGCFLMALVKAQAKHTPA